MDFLKKKREKLLPWVICLTMPGLELINSSPFREELELPELIARWLLVAFFLLMLWYTTAWGFARFRGAKLIGMLLLCNLGVVGMLAFFQFFIFDPNEMSGIPYPLWLLLFRLGIVASLFLAIQSSTAAIRQNEQLKTENFALQSENYRAQLDQLRKQVNPHFLFNSLSTLQTMIRAQNPRSAEFVYNLSDVYRQLLQTRESNVIKLQEELDFLGSYIYLLKERHGEAVKIEIDVEPSSLQYSLPTFALQLLVENATKHNIVSESRPLTIRIFQQTPLTINVSNNLQPKKNVTSFGVGLENLKKRYQLMEIPKGVQVFQDEHTYEVSLTLF